MAKSGYFMLVMDENKQHSDKKRGYIFKIFKQHLSLTWKKPLLIKKKRVDQLSADCRRGEMREKE